jgi:hypothetical protein
MKNGKQSILQSTSHHNITSYNILDIFGTYQSAGGRKKVKVQNISTPPLEHNISDGHKQRNDGCGACQRRPCLEPDSLTIAACDVLSLFLAAVRPLLAPSYS